MFKHCTLLDIIIWQSIQYSILWAHSCYCIMMTFVSVYPSVAISDEKLVGNIIVHAICRKIEGL